MQIPNLNLKYSAWWTVQRNVGVFERLTPVGFYSEVLCCSDILLTRWDKTAIKYFTNRAPCDLNQVHAVTTLCCLSGCCFQSFRKISGVMHQCCSVLLFSDSLWCFCSWSVCSSVKHIMIIYLQLNVVWVFDTYFDSLSFLSHILAVLFNSVRWALVIWGNKSNVRSREDFPWL